MFKIFTKTLLLPFILCNIFLLTSSYKVSAGETLVSEQASDFTEFHSGVNVILRPEHYDSLTDLDWKVDALLNRLTSMNVEAISINWLLHTDNVFSNSVTFGAKTPEIEAIGLLAREAVSRGFIVGLRPIIDEELIVRNGGRNEWRGTIRPRSVSDWFSTYTVMLYEYAAIAEAVEVDFVVIATELTSMEQYPERWRELIGTIREVYSGQLTYSSNQVVSSTIPWDALDFIGVDAFLALDVSDNASVAEIEAAWQDWLTLLTEQAAAVNRPLVFTEIGTTSQTGSIRRTWVWDHRTSINLETQRRYYEASCAVWKDSLQGMYWWVIQSNLWMIADPQNDKTFSPLGKPAEEAIRNCFK